MRCKGIGVRGRLVLGVLIGMIAACTAQAQIVINPTVTNKGSLFHYNYSVANSTGNDLAIITLESLPFGSSTVQNLTAPSGFQASFDTGLGLLSFLSDSQLFQSGQTVAGFQFDSPLLPKRTTYSAIALHRIAYGMLLICAFSLGLASVLVAIGLLVVSARHWFDRMPTSGRLMQRLPVASAAMITLIGVVLVVRALGTGTP